MDKNRTRGMGKQVKGSVREVVGRVTGNRSLEMKGKGQKVAGKIQEGYGAFKDEVRASKEQSRERARTERK
jgi:uncharacterized protein YjbJ (UPF0337 family)